ncbi:hypothetical protein B9Z37_05200 [Limnohabitans parvus II-B4]|uniref:Uncharacterized protein n=1 Tax=Limnohabitans parvus II-B4 TaxID=1293052 RepID=A0A315E7T0_9BURK|nr:hypothetical protein B9Z37_05200 [Limnohabitans parvus II-B4]
MLIMSWAQTIFCFLLTHLCTVMFCGRPQGLHIGGVFWHQDMPRPVPLHSPQEGRKKRFDPLR